MGAPDYWAVGLTPGKRTACLLRFLHATESCPKAASLPPLHSLAERAIHPDQGQGPFHSIAPGMSKSGSACSFRASHWRLGHCCTCWLSAASCVYTLQLDPSLASSHHISPLLFPLLAGWLKSQQGLNAQFLYWCAGSNPGSPFQMQLLVNVPGKVVKE